MTAIDLLMFVSLLAFFLLLVYGEDIISIIKAWIQKDKDDEEDSE